MTKDDAFRLFSPAFEGDTELPVRFTQIDDDVSPPLQWNGVPDGTAELVLICEDPDTDEGVVTHWVVFGLIPGAVTELPEDLGDDALVIGEGWELYQGLNEFDNAGWSGPLESDERGPHRYFFRLSAVDTELVELSPGATTTEVKEAMRGHVIATAELVGIA